MKKRIYTLFCITALLTAATNMQAQTCNPNFIVNTQVTNSTCLSNGQITVTLSGDTINLFNIQYGLTGAGGFNIPPSSSNVFPNLPPGSYNLTVRAFCRVDNSYDVTQTVSNVAVGGNYTAPQATLNSSLSRNSYAACPMGIIALTVTGGSGTFTFTIVDAPLGVTTPQVVVPSQSGNVYTLPGQNWPAGNYQIQVADNCYSAMANVTLNTITTFPSFYTPNSSGFRPDDNNLNNSCNVVGWIAYSNAFSSNSDWLRYFNDGLYEIGSLPLSGGVAQPASSVTNWVPWTSNNNSTPIWLNLGANINTFYNNGTNTIAIYTRLKNCSSASTNFSTYIYNPSNYSPYYTPESNCTSIQTTPQNSAPYRMLCYPLTLTITQGGSTVYTKSNWLWNADATTSIPIDYSKGSYTITFTDQNGTTQTTTQPGFTYTTPSYIHNCNDYSLYYSASITGAQASCYPYIAIATTRNTSTNAIVGVDTFFVSGLKVSSFALQYNTAYNITYQYAIGTQAGPININRSSSTSPTMYYNSVDPCTVNWGSFYVYGYFFPVGTVFKLTDPSGSTYTTTTTTLLGNTTLLPASVIPPGTYTLEYDLGGTGACINTITYPHPGFYDYINFGHTEEQDCSGLKIKPTGTVTYLGSNQPNGTFFRLVNGPAGSYSTNMMLPGDSATLSTSGTYVLAISASNTNNACNLGYDTIHYVAQPLTLDPTVTSSYVCVDETVGEIIVSAINGTTPYTYKLYDVHSPQYPYAVDSITTNGAVHFHYGQADSTYTVRVSDNCGSSFPQDVSINDLKTARIVYSLTQNVCPGDSILLNCITLGTTSYAWTGPSYTSSDQNPKIYNADASMTGWYKVTVWPEYCGQPVADSIYIQVSELTAGSVTANQEFCAGTTPVALDCVFTGGSGNYTYQWQSSADGLTGWTDISGATGATYVPPSNAVGTFYYRKRTTDTCGTVASNAIKVVVKACSAPVNPNLRNLPKS